jgi:quercetin dioxygenase-like cupin family protein
MQLMEGWVFNDKNPNAELLFVAPEGRILRFALRPGRSVWKHSAPHSPVYVVVLKGQGMYAGADGKEQRVGHNTLFTFDAGNNHSIRAEGEE